VLAWANRENVVSTDVEYLPREGRLLPRVEYRELHMKPTREEAVLRKHLHALKIVLGGLGENEMACMIEDALSGSRKEFASFLASNELWGGAGSVADQAGIGQDREGRRLVEAALINLGEEQIRDGIVNVRTQMWVEAFRQWQRDGV
jgi:hypothetical protein